MFSFETIFVRCFFRGLIFLVKIYVYKLTSTPPPPPCVSRLKTVFVNKRISSVLRRARVCVRVQIAVSRYAARDVVYNARRRVISGAEAASLVVVNVRDIIHGGGGGGDRIHHEGLMNEYRQTYTILPGPRTPSAAGWFSLLINILFTAGPRVRASPGTARATAFDEISRYDRCPFVSPGR